MRRTTFPICLLIAACLTACTTQPQVQARYTDHESITLQVNILRNDSTIPATEQTEPPTEPPTESPTIVPTEPPTGPVATEHQHDFIVISQSDPSCEEPGFTEYQCLCGEGYTEEIPVLEHDYRPEAMVDPTCTEWGYTVYACSGCDTCYDSDYTEPWGHTYTQHTYAPTLEDQGYTEYTCTSCGYSYLDDFVEKLTQKEETVYATCAVNIRSGPGTEYALLDTLYYGESILKLADADSEWSLVQYGNTYAYMYSAYLSTTKPEPVSAYALIGTFSIPAVGVDVDCYDSYSQEVVDAYNSAALFRHQGHDVIADHVNQGFSAIKLCTPGTTAYLYTPNGTYEYVCADVIQGHNDGYNLTDENGNLISDTYPGSLVCYTCNDSSQNITLVFFEAVGSAKEDNERDPNGLGHSFHTWSDWEIAWEVYEDDGDHYGWRKRICTVCGEEAWISL